MDHLQKFSSGARWYTIRLNQYYAFGMSSIAYNIFYISWHSFSAVHPIKFIQKSQRHLHSTYTHLTTVLVYVYLNLTQHLNNRAL